jgi:hypothetical protein
MWLLIVLMISFLLLDSCKTLKRDFYKYTLSRVQFLVDDCSLVYAEQTDCNGCFAMTNRDHKFLQVS